MTQPTPQDAYALALDVMQRLDRHEETCGERYARIEENQREARTERREMHAENTKKLDTMSGRFDRLYGRAWAALIMLSGLLGGGLLYFIKAYLEAHP